MHPIGPPDPGPAGPGTSPADYAPVLDVLPDAVLIHRGGDGRILEVNQACLAMFGYGPEALARMTVGDLSALGEGYTQDLAEARIQAARAQGRSEFRWRSRRADGSCFWSEVRLMAAPAGGADRVVAVVRDISAQVEADARLAQASADWQATFDAAGDAITLLDAQGAVRRRNRAAEAMAAEPGGDLAQRGQATFPVGARGRRSLEWARGDRVFDVTLDPIRNAEGVLDGAVHIARDITARKVEQAALTRITRLYAALSMVNQYLIRARSPEALYADICRALVEGGGFWAAWIAQPDPATGWFVPLAHHGAWEGWAAGLRVQSRADRKEGQGTMGVAYREMRPVIANDFETDPLTVHWRSAGRSREFRAAAAFPILRGDGSVFGVLSMYAKEIGYFGEQEIHLLQEVCEDITYFMESLAQEAQQKDLEARLQETLKLESLGNLAGGVAHDMNNVLGAILSLATIEEERCGRDAPIRRSLESIVQACTRGRDVVQGLLAFARRDLGELRPVDLNREIEEIVRLLGRTTLQRVQFALDLDPALRWVEGDPAALNHAFMNICVNSVDAMPRGGTITVRTRNGGDGTVSVVFEDTGEGMPEAVARRATEPFFTTKPAGKGTGLGLSRVYGTVKAHQGTLAIASTPGVGTRVELGFPGREAEPARTAPAPPAPAPAPRGLKILLVDDDTLLRESIADVLVWQGHTPEAVPGGREALDLLAQGRAYDLVILDLNMPGMSGGAALPRILELCPDQKVLVSSGYLDASVRPWQDTHPNVRVLGKPFSTKELAGKIAEFCGPG